jgi:hypothetical protein
MAEFVEGSPKWREREWLTSRDEAWWEIFFDRLAEGESPVEIAQAVKVRYAILGRVVDEDEGLRARYETALRVAAEKRAHEALSIADGAEQESVGVSKLQIETRMKLSGKWHRPRYGDSVTVDVTKRVVLDLRFGRAEPEKPVERLVNEAPSTVLPAPKLPEKLEVVTEI